MSDYPLSKNVVTPGVKRAWVSTAEVPQSLLRAGDVRGLADRPRRGHSEGDGPALRTETAISAVNMSGIRTRGVPELDIPDLPEAACKGISDPEPFHPVTPAARGVAEAKRICGGCPERAACLAWSLSWERRNGPQGGVWGGLTEWERRDLIGDEVKRCRSGEHEMTGYNVIELASGKGSRCRACFNTSNARSLAKRRARQRGEGSQIGA